MIAAAASGGKMRREITAGFAVAAGIVALGSALGFLAVLGKPGVLRRPDPARRPVLLLPDFANRTGRSELVVFAGRLSGAVRERLAAEPDGIFGLSPRRLRPVLSEDEREEGLVRIAARLGADYVLVGSLESGPGSPLPPGSSWGPPPFVTGGGPPTRLDLLLVRDSTPPEVFAERFPLGAPPDSAAEQERLARWVAERVAISLRRP